MLVLHPLLLKELPLRRTDTELVHCHFILQVVYLKISRLFSHEYRKEAVIHLGDANNLHASLPIVLGEVAQRLRVSIDVMSLQSYLALVRLTREYFYDLHEMISIADKQLHAVNLAIAMKQGTSAGYMAHLTNKIARQDSQWLVTVEFLPRNVLVFFCVDDFVDRDGVSIGVRDGNILVVEKREGTLVSPACSLLKIN